jgi:hypothetical protein
LLTGVETAVTVMVNDGSEDVFWPSLTLITMFEKVPTFEAEGVPLSAPVVVLNEAHDGIPVIENVIAF